METMKPHGHFKTILIPKNAKSSEPGVILPDYFRVFAGMAQVDAVVPDGTGDESITSFPTVDAFCDAYGIDGEAAFEIANNNEDGVLHKLPGMGTGNEDYITFSRAREILACEPELLRFGVNEWLPTITLTGEDKVIGYRRYKIEGGEVSDEWSKTPKSRGESIWCDVSIWKDSHTLGSYGGTVWPMAWPLLFESLPGSAQSGAGQTLIRELGLKLFREADARGIKK